MRRAALVLVAALAACSDTSSPDARVPQKPQPDAPLAATPDAAVARPDAPLATPDAPLATPDAAPPVMPDAAPPDAPPPMGPADLLINELSPNFDNRHDLVELLVTKSGTAAGWKLEQDYPHDDALLATLPDVIVFEGQFIIVHLVPDGTTAAAETLAVDEHKTPDNFDTAWDFLGEALDLDYNNRVISLRDPDGKVANAVPFYRDDLSDPDVTARFFPANLQTIIDDGLWDETCVPAPCSYSSNLAEVTASWLGAGTSADTAAPAGASVQRKRDARDNKASDWWPAATTPPFNSYGAVNP